MTKEENEIADFILGLFTSSMMYQYEIYDALIKKYGDMYNPDPRLVVEVLKDRGYIRTEGEACFMLTTYGENYLANKKRKNRSTAEDFKRTQKMLYYMTHSPREEARRKAEKKKKRKDQIVFASEVIGTIVAILTFLLTYILPRLKWL